MPADPTMRSQSFGRDGLSTLERWGIALSHRAVARVLRRYDHPRLLDLGCGYSCLLFAAFHETLGPSTAVDIDLDPALNAVSNLTPLTSSIEAAWERLEPRSFDVITLVNVLEHTWNPHSILEEAFQRLAPGGTVVVNVPTWLGKTVHEFQAFRLGLSSPVEIDDHKHYFDKRDLWPLLVRAGFKPSRIRLRYHKLRLNLFATAQRE